MNRELTQEEREIATRLGQDKVWIQGLVAAFFKAEAFLERKAARQAQESLTQSPAHEQAA